MQKRLKVLLTCMIGEILIGSSVQAADVNLISDPGFETSVAGFKVVTDKNNDWISRSSGSPMQGSRSLNLGLTGDGHEASLKKAVSGSAQSLAISALVRSNTRSAAQLELCAVAAYANGSVAHQCSLAGNQAGVTTSVSASLQLQPGVLLSSVSFDLKQVGKGRIDYDLDEASMILAQGGAPQPAPSPSPSPTAPAPSPSPVPTPSPTVSPPPVTGGIHLPPAGKVSWDWQIGAGSDSEVTLPPGVQMMDVDLFAISAAEIAKMKSMGIYAVCYLNAGSYQPGLPDSGEYPQYLKLQADPDWPGEYFLDVTDVFKPGSVLATILNARLQLCKDKGFEAVEPDNLQNDENISGGKITTQQQIDFNGWIADAAHAHSLAVFQKNGPDKILLKDRTGQMMVEKFDGILNEQCQEYNECGPLAEYVSRGKLALDVEYNRKPDCALSAQLDINTLGKDLGLTGGTSSRYKRLTCP